MASVKKGRLYLGVDVGGTKILAALAEESGTILARERCATPREGGADEVFRTIERLIVQTLQKGNIDRADLVAMGVAVPGVVEPRTGRVVVTPNMSLSGVSLGTHLEEHFHVAVALGNDCNLGTLGETWLGSARKAGSAFGIFVGTGIGGGFVRKGKLWRGAREAAGEIGHMVMQIDGGLRCGCKNYGCLETLASRTAIENQIRAAVAGGRGTVLGELLRGDLSIIRSSALRQALERNDELATEVVHRAAKVLGAACVTVRHLIDPELIVLGGGVLKECSDYMMPIVENCIGSDRLPGARDGGRVLLSALGDDAVVLGAVALARMKVNRSPFKKKFAVAPEYPEVAWAGKGELAVGGTTFDRDVYLLADGTVKKRKKKFAGEGNPASHQVEAGELERACRGGPEVLFVGGGETGAVQLSEDAQRYLRHRSIECRVLRTPEAIEAYNRCGQRKAALLHTGC